MKKLLLASAVCALSLGCAAPTYAKKLFDAALSDDLIYVQYLIQYRHEDIDSRDEKGRTAIMRAAQFRHLEVVKYLMPSGVIN